ncbi:uncharacterized protein LOC111102288 isoform X2 [Crassostrea virginica]
MIFIMALTMCTLPLLVFEMISVLNGFAKAAQSNCEEFKFLKNCKKDTDEFQLCHANAWINATFTIFHGQIPEYDKFSKICEFDICTDENPLVSCANQDAYKRIIPYITTNMESSKPPIGMCPCECGYLDKISYWNLEENQLKQYNELNQTLAQIKRILKIETKNISSFRRRKKSADDKRASARFTGYFGAFVMTLMFGGILLLDLPVILRQIQTLSRHIRGTYFKH